jgi:hypothetical protein
VHGTCATLRDAAAELGAGQSQDVPQHPQDWHIVRGIDRFGITVDEYGSILRHFFLPMPVAQKARG